MSTIEVSVILPTYNEVGNIVNLIDTIRKVLDNKRIRYEIIVVDDNSPDKTGLLVQKNYVKQPSIRGIIRKKERGLATAIRRGIEQSVGEVIIVMDTDFNHDPTVIPKLLQRSKKFDVVVGSRFIKGGGMANKLREKFSMLFNVGVHLLLGVPVHDCLSGFFAIKQDKLEQIPFDKVFWGYGDYFIRLLYFAKIHGYTFAEVPSFYKNREYGESKSKFIQMFKDYAYTAIQLRLGKIQ